MQFKIVELHGYHELDGCLAVQTDPVTSLAVYDLSKRERDRLAQAVWQPGMSANCTIYRATRITALNTVAPLTMGLLGPVLRDIMDAYWDEHPVHEVRFAREAARFIDWLEQHAEILPMQLDGILELAKRELAVEEATLTSRTG